MQVGLGVEIEVELGCGEPGCGIGAAGEVVVGKLIDECSGFGTVGSSRLGRSGDRHGERGHCERRR
jgi:hypothetical protein